jgi:hypothetical protein
MGNDFMTIKIVEGPDFFLNVIMFVIFLSLPHSRVFFDFDDPVTEHRNPSPKYELKISHFIHFGNTVIGHLICQVGGFNHRMHGCIPFFRPEI